MTTEELIKEIKTAFENVTLQDGIGLWEAQGLDNYANNATLLKLKKQDEREDWNALSYEDLVECDSSLSFFDAKGMRFCLPNF